MKRCLRLFLAAIAVLYVATAGPAMAAGKKVALIIGNSSYQFGERLPNPGNDADRVAQAARLAGFDVIILKDLGQMQFKASLREFRTKADGAEVALLYYAGHGIEKDNANYLIPIDAKLADPIDLRDEGIDLALVIDNMSKAERRVILLDACRDNPFRNRWSDATRSFFKNGLGEMQLPFNSLVIFATAAGMKTPDGDAGGNSSFAVALANQIVKPGLALQNFGPSVMDEVKKTTGGQQQPYYQATLDSTKAFFVPPPADPGNGLSNEDVDWFKAQNTRTAKAMRDYLLKHPQGKHAEMATSMYQLFLDMERSATKPGLGTTTAVADATPPQPAPSPELVAQQRPEAAPTYGSAPAATQPTAQVVPQSSAPVYGPVAPPIVFNPAPQPQPAPVFTPQPPAPAPTTQAPAANFPPAQTQTTTTYTLPPAQAPITQAPVASAPQAAVQSGTYVAPPTQRQYGVGGFPIMPEPPAFSLGPYPTCKDNWLSVPATDPVRRVEATNDCKKQFSAYKTNWLNRYREAMNVYGGVVGEIYTKEVAPAFFDHEAERQQFYREMIRRNDGVHDGGYLMADYERALVTYDADFKAVVDSYNRASGCNGYPTPAGLAPNPNC